MYTWPLFLRFSTRSWRSGSNTNNASAALCCVTRLWSAISFRAGHRCADASAKAGATRTGAAGPRSRWRCLRGNERRGTTTLEKAGWRCSLPWEPAQWKRTSIKHRQKETHRLKVTSTALAHRFFVVSAFFKLDLFPLRRWTKSSNVAQESNLYVKYATLLCVTISDEPSVSSTFRQSAIVCVISGIPLWFCANSFRVSESRFHKIGWFTATSAADGQVYISVNSLIRSIYTEE